MRLPFVLSSVLLVLPSVSAGTLAAQDDVLAVERREDLRSRDVAMRQLQAIHTEVHLTGIAPRDLCRHFATLTGDKLSFVFAAKGDAAAAPIDLQLRSVSLWSAMAAVQLTTGLRFVWRCGVVFLVAREDVKPLAYLEVYDLRPMVAALHSFPGPRLELRGPGDEGPLFPPEEESTTTVSGFTADGVEALIRQFVLPDSWATEGISLTNNRGLFFVRQTLQGHREIQRLLVQLGLWSPPRVVVVRPR